MTRRKKISLAVLIITMLIAALLYFYLFTTTGSAMLVRFIISRVTDAAEINIGKIEGRLVDTLVFEDLYVTDIEGLPQAASLKAQSIKASIKSLSLAGIDIEINNARVSLISSDPILIYGTYNYKDMDLTLYTRSLYVVEIKNFFESGSIIKDIRGNVRNINLKVTGHSQKPHIDGSFDIESVVYRDDFAAESVSCSFSLDFDYGANMPALYGSLKAAGGEVFGVNTARVRIISGVLNFDGDYTNPSFKLTAVSRVQDYNIDITLNGTVKEPDFALSSQPHATEEHILLMLATNRAWKATGKALEEGRISSDVYSDLIGYFLLNETGSGLGGLLRDSEVSLKYEEGEKGIGFRQNIFDRLRAGYTVTQSDDEEIGRKQKIEGEYKVMENISVGAEQEVEQPLDKEGTTNEKKIFLKYEKGF